MTKQWPTARLGELLKRSDEAIDPQPDTEYREITVRLWGNGVVERGRVLGGALTGRRFVAHGGQFIASRIDARNGAMGLVPSSLDGALVTNDFPLFDLNTELLEPAFLGWLCRTASFVGLCLRASEGTTNRVRLKEERFLSLEVSLPPLAEQQRVVARIEELSAKVNEASSLRHDATEAAKALQLHIARDLFPKPSDRVVADWVRFQTGYAFKSEWFSESGVRLVRNANVGHGTLDWGEAARLPESRCAEFSRFALQEGDIVITLDRPIISTGVKVARVRKEDLPCLLLQRVARAQFLGDALLPDYFFQWLHSPHFIGAIDPGRSNGVPHISHKSVEAIPFAVPTISEQRRIVAELDALQAQIETLKRQQAAAAAELDALLPAVLDRAFKGELV
jgi:type I restriction enzyme S subunit